MERPHIKPDIPLPYDKLDRRISMDVLMLWASIAHHNTNKNRGEHHA